VTANGGANLVSNRSFDETVELTVVLETTGDPEEVIAIFDNAQQASSPTTSVGRLANPEGDVVAFQQTVCVAPDPRFDAATGDYADVLLDIRTLQGTCDIDVNRFIGPEYKAFPNVNGIPELVVAITEPVPDTDTALFVGPIVKDGFPQILIDYLDGVPPCGGPEAPMAITAALPGEAPRLAEPPGFAPSTWRCNRPRSGSGRYSVDVFYVFEDQAVLSVNRFLLELYRGLRSTLNDSSIPSDTRRSLSQTAVRIIGDGATQRWDSALDRLNSLLVFIDQNQALFSNGPPEQNLWGMAFSRTLVAAGMTFEKRVAPGSIYVPPPLDNLPDL
jgi:hypothetical protein